VSKYTLRYQYQAHAYKIKARQQAAKIAELEKESKKLEKPAMVGAGIFREGVDKNLVIEAAQRQYEYQEKAKALKDQG
jgi:hypothetical protein